jgi:hypothetical protein
LREERRKRVLENRVLGILYGPRREEVRGEWKKLRNEELNDLYSSPNISRVVKSRRMRWLGHGREQSVYKIAFTGLIEQHQSN